MKKDIIIWLSDNNTKEDIDAFIALAKNINLYDVELKQYQSTNFNTQYLKVSYDQQTIEQAKTRQAGRKRKEPVLLTVQSAIDDVAENGLDDFLKRYNISRATYYRRLKQAKEAVKNGGGSFEDYFFF